MEDPYETGDGSETWYTRECIGDHIVPVASPVYYQRAAPSTPRSSRSATPVEADDSQRSSRKGVYVLPSPPLKRWLREQSHIWSDEHVDMMTEEQFARVFSIRKSDWVFQVSECDTNAPTMRDITLSLSKEFMVSASSRVIMIYFGDMRSHVVRVEGCVLTEQLPDPGLGIRGSIVRHVISTLEMKGFRMAYRADDSESFCTSRLELTERCRQHIAGPRFHRLVTVWLSMVLEPAGVRDAMKLRILAHGIDGKL